VGGKPKYKYKGLKHRDDWKEIPVINPPYTPDEFDEIRQAIESRIKRGRKRKDNIFLVPKGVMRCGLCGGSIVTNRQGKYTYYACYWSLAGKQKREERGHAKCTLPFVWREYVDYYVWDELVWNIIWNIDALEEFLDVGKLKAKIHVTSKDIKRLKKDRQSLKNERKRLYNLYAKSQLKDNDLDELLHEKDEEIKLLDKKVEHKENELKSYKSTTLSYQDIKTVHDEIMPRMVAGNIIEELTVKEKQKIIKHLLGNMDIRLIPSRDEDAWYTSRGNIGVEMNWEGHIKANDFSASLREMDKSYLSNFQYENGGNGTCYYGGK